MWMKMCDFLNLFGVLHVKGSKTCERKLRTNTKEKKNRNIKSNRSTSSQCGANTFRACNNNKL